ncbi:hypothetical protein JOD25_002653 [Kurthia huakuii]|nr:hypothetical protein [Kurthia huakuii]
MKKSPFSKHRAYAVNENFYLPYKWQIITIVDA